MRIEHTFDRNGNLVVDCVSLLKNILLVQAPAIMKLDNAERAMQAVYQSGYKARVEGRPITDNPNMSKNRRDKWVEGWKAAHEHKGFEDYLRTLPDYKGSNENTELGNVAEYQFVDNKKSPHEAG